VRTTHCPPIALAFVLLMAWPSAAFAQTTLDGVLRFLLTNRSIPTDDFERDAQAAAETAVTISTLLVSELGRLPITSGGGGFTYRLNQDLGVMERSSASFGPFYVERSLTIGRGRALIGAVYHDARFTKLDGRSLRDGTLLATASRIRGDETPFDIETVSLEVRTSTLALLANVGLTDRLDVGVAVPIVSVNLRGERVDTYRGQRSVQAAATGSSSGIGDVVLRAKYNAYRGTVLGIAAGVEAHLATGRVEDLVGTGVTRVQPLVIISGDGGRISAHGQVGPVVGEDNWELAYGAGLNLTATDRLTLGAEVIGRRTPSAARLTQAIEPHPTLVGIDTIRLSTTREATDRAVAVLGAKWNIAGAWLFGAHVQRSITSIGLSAGWAPVATLDYSFGR
jgi:hypothetical protein